MKNFHERPEDVAKALREMRLQGILVGFPLQNAKGDLLFAVEGFTITTAQLLALLDRDELDLDGVRKASGRGPEVRNRAKPEVAQARLGQMIDVWTKQSSAGKTVNFKIAGDRKSGFVCSAKMDGRDIKEVTGSLVVPTRKEVEGLFADYVAGGVGPTLQAGGSAFPGGSQIN